MDNNSSGDSWKGEIQNKAKDGSLFWVDQVINPIKNEKGEVYQYMAIQYVITKRKEAESEKESLVEDLTEFGFQLAHYVRKPLANILGCLQLLEEFSFDQDVGEFMEIIDHSAKELDEVIKKQIKTLERNIHPKVIENFPKGKS